jgi:glucose/arabinose dehydrogenase
MGGKGKAVVFILLCVAAHSAAALTLDLQLVTGAVTSPVYVAHAGDGSGRLFIVEQTGRIKIFDLNTTTLLATPYLNIANQTLFSGEQGLLSVAFHPGYATNGHFYVYFTNPAGSSNIVARFTASPPSANTVNTNTLMTVLRIPHVNAGNHNGGQIQFGSDGYLYIATGDGGGSCDNTGTSNNAQNVSLLLGKMLRIDVSNFATNYTIPPGNPFVGMAGLDEIWATGLRNPWRFSFDRLTGDMFIGDVGQGTREEVSFQPAASPGGENYGWPCLEGTATNTCSFGCAAPGMTPPIIEYSRSPQRAITGGYRYRGNDITPLYGAYIYCDYFSPAPIIGATTNSMGAWTTNLLVSAAFNVSSFGEDEAGNLYVCRHVTAGEIYRLVWRDMDGDGMADEWETENGVSDAGSDGDGDGFTNVQEFRAATNPNDAGSALRITSIVPGGGGYEVSFASSSNKLYRLKTKTDLSLAGWTVVTNHVAGTGGILSIAHAAGGTGTQRFYRVRLPSELPQPSD